ncbi:hypothetical protein GCM10023323_12250 [Streptomyces thinghirensis]|uniref:Uncharacterized protein n=1 Tax=Streptomyces thinghirensis TaxID=551547 RepID=A0ABP9SZ35_9ACTN
MITAVVGDTHGAGDRDVLRLLPGHLLGMVRKDDPTGAARLRGYWDGMVRKDDPTGAARLRGYWDGPVRRRAEQGSATWRTLWDLRTVLEGPC